MQMLFLLTSRSNVRKADIPSAYSLVVTRAPVAPQVLGSTPRGSKFSQNLMTIFILVVGSIPLDSEAHVVTSSILRICQSSLRKCS
jgi:hypothetical protein